MTVRILHVLDHSIPMQSGYTFRTRAILREQRRLGWETFHLTSPKHTASSAAHEEVEGLRFYRTAPSHAVLTGVPGSREVALMRALARRLWEVALLTRPEVLKCPSPVLTAPPPL